MDMTREGNIIFAIDAPIRSEMPKETLCRNCVHASDSCKEIFKVGRMNRESKKIWTYCEGFAGVEK